MIDPSKLREVLKFPADKDLTDLINQLTDEWEQQTNLLWELNASYVQEIFNPDNFDFVKLDLVPVNSITTVEERSSLTGTWSTVTATSYYLTDRRVILRVDDDYFSKFVRVTYSGGYSIATLPLDIRDVIFIQAKFAEQRYLDKNIFVKGASGEGGSVTFFESSLYHPKFIALAKKLRAHG